MNKTLKKICRLLVKLLFIFLSLTVTGYAENETPQMDLLQSNNDDAAHKRYLSSLLTPYISRPLNQNLEH